jgi:hypothetical protein
VQRRIITTLKGLKKEFMSVPHVRRVDKMKLRALMTGKGVFYLMYRASDNKKKQ